jgi:hypothetical protein
MNAITRRTAPATTDSFTDITWDMLGGTYGRDTKVSVGWMGQHDLSVQLWKAVPHFDYETAASAVEAAGSHLPVRIVWTNPFNGQVEVHDGYAVIEYVAMNPTTNPRLRLRYSGFCHYVYASQVRSIEQVGVSMSYEPAPADA